MAYDYDVDILAALWTGAEDGEEPYATILADNPELTNETSEQRILSSIELLRSHMELLASREEANVLHFAISRLIRHTAGGSNPFSDDAKITTAVGNVKNPTFPAGASLDVVIDGVTYSPASASGGDCATVASELNAVLDASIPGTAEVTAIDVAGATSDGLSGTYFTLNSAGDVNQYYVWFDWNGVTEITQIDPVADVEGSLGGTYFTINSAGDATNYYAWMSHSGRGESVSLDFTGVTGATLPTGAVPAAYFDIDSTSTAYRFWYSDGSTTAPAAGGRTLVAVSFTGGDTDQDISDSTLIALVAADADFGAFGNGGGTTPVITGTLASVGDVTDPVDGAVATGATITTTTQGLAAATDPAPGGLTEIQISYNLDDADTEIGSAINTAIGAANGGADFLTEGSDPVSVSNKAVGDTTDAADVDTGFGFSIIQQGDDASVDPAPSGLTAITVSLGSGFLGDSEIGSNLRAAIGANADFSVEGTGTECVVNNNGTGVTTDAADVDSGVGISVSVQGVDDIDDSVGVTAVCVFPGPRLAIQGQEDFVTFSLSNGTGGIIGPAGIIPGERSSTPKRVANQGRDSAINNVVGTLKKLGGL